MWLELVLGLLKNKYTYVVLLVVAAIAAIYYLYNENKELSTKLMVYEQNLAAAQDTLHKQKDSVQTLTVFVANLQQSSSEWRHKYLAVETKYQLALDTIRILKRRPDSTSVVGDSLGIVTFKGTQGIASYDGQTSVNVRSKESSYRLNIAFSDIDVSSELFFDETDNLWKMRTVALSPGVKLRGITTVDEQTYRQISGLRPIELKQATLIGVGTLLTQDRIYAGVVIAPRHWMFTVHYKVFERRELNEGWSDRLMVGAHYVLW